MFKRLWNWFFPTLRGPGLIYRGQRWLNEAVVAEETCRQLNKIAWLECQLEKREAQLSSVIHMYEDQKRRQLSYEKHTFACSMGEVVLDNQQMISRIARDLKSVPNTVTKDTLNQLNNASDT